MPRKTATKARRAPSPLWRRPCDDTIVEISHAVCEAYDAHGSAASAILCILMHGRMMTYPHLQGGAAVLRERHIEPTFAGIMHAYRLAKASEQRQVTTQRVAAAVDAIFAGQTGGGR